MVISDPDTAVPEAVWEGLRRFSVLPAWLRDAVRSDLVADALRALPDFAGGTVTAEEVRVRQPRLEGEHWSARYQVTVRECGRAARRVTLVGDLYPPGVEPAEARSTGTFGAAGWSGWLPQLGLSLRPEPTDVGLPALPVLTDPRRARAVLETMIRAGAASYRDFHLAGCTPHLLRQHPNSRATIAYDLHYPPAVGGDDWPARVVAKTYADDTGEQTDEAMRVLWAARKSDWPLAVAEPLGYQRELHLLIQGWVRSEQTFADLLRDAVATGNPQAMRRVLDAAELAAAALAALHTSDVDHGPHIGVHDELAGLGDLADHLMGMVVGLAGAAAPLLGWLSALAERDHSDAAVATHRSFHPGQALLAGGHVGVIDFDDLCRAEPALDVAQFLATTKYLAVSATRTGGNPPPGVDLTRLVAADRVCTRFLRVYQALAPISPARVALWESMHLFTYVLHSWTSIRPHRLTSAIALLSRQLHTLESR
jgi:hypothetical protein